MYIKCLKAVTFRLVAAAFMLFSPCLRGQSPQDYKSFAKDPRIVWSGTKEDYRSCVIPYPSREEALDGRGNSAYVIPLLSWERDTVPGGIRYRARFKVHYSWDNRSVIFRVRDVSASFSVTVNGNGAGYSQNGTGRCEFDVTDMIIPDYNEVSVTIYNEYAAEKLLSKSGEAPRLGSACILSQPAVRVHDVAVKTSTDEEYGYMALNVVLQSILLNPKEYVIHYELLNPDGQTVAMSQKRVTTGMLSRDTVRFVARVPDPLKWNHETPNLYTLLIRSQNDGRFGENIAFKIGFREVSYAQGQLHIDGLAVPLYAVRYAANENDALTAQRLAKFKGEGYNCIVADGLPQPDYFYSLCDSLGLYVCDAAAIDTSTGPQHIQVGGNPSNDPLWKDAYTDRIRSVYYSSAVHPSVVMVSPARNSLNGYCLYESYMELKRIDPTLPVFYAEADGEWNNDIDSSYLFRCPRVSADDSLPVSVAMQREGDVCVLIFTNNRAVTPARGTYKITLKSGRRIISSLVGELNLDGGGQCRCEVAMPSAGIKKGTVSADISIQRSSPWEKGTERGKVSDMYETVNVKFAL